MNFSTCSSRKSFDQLSIRFAVFDPGDGLGQNVRETEEGVAFVGLCFLSSFRVPFLELLSEKSGPLNSSVFSSSPESA